MIDRQDRDREDTERDSPFDWRDYRRLVLQELERLDRSVKELDANMQRMHRENQKVLTDGSAQMWKKLSEQDVAIAMLQVKAGVFGAVAGAIPSGLISILIYFLQRGH